MVDKILGPVGLPYKETLFRKPPQTTYAIYHDSQEVRGPDYHNLITTHDVTIEVYEYAPDASVMTAIETQFDLLGMEYTKQERYWIQEEQLYQTIYEFTYIEKGAR